MQASDFARRDKKGEEKLQTASNKKGRVSGVKRQYHGIFKIQNYA
jgi:hypothetical protein